MSETREPWIVRDYVPEDEPCVVSTWLKGYAHARDVRSFPSMREAGVDGSPDEIRYWRVHHPIVEKLVATSTVRVLCDPKRSTYEPGAPAVIWAWSCTDADSVHWVMVKRSAVRAGMGQDFVRALLGDRLTRRQRTTFDLVDLRRLGMIPEEWQYDRRWLSSLRALSMQMLEGIDQTYVAIGNHVLDQHRQQWRASSERDAA